MNPLEDHLKPWKHPLSKNKGQKLEGLKLTIWITRLSPIFPLASNLSPEVLIKVTLTSSLLSETNILDEVWKSLFGPADAIKFDILNPLAGLDDATLQKDLDDKVLTEFSRIILLTKDMLFLLNNFFGWNSKLLYLFATHLVTYSNQD